MEFNTIHTLNNYSKNIQQKLVIAFQKDIDDILHKIHSEYNLKISISEFISKYNYNIPVETTCHGISQNGNKCFNKTFQNELYCKKHISQKQIIKKTVYEPFTIEMSKMSIVKPTNYTLKLIDNQKCFVDDSFVYDVDTFERIGYKTSKETYILSDNPFLLNVV